MSFQRDTHPLEVTRELKAQPSVVYQALTDATVMSRWFFAGSPGGCNPNGMRGCNVVADAQISGRYQIAMLDADEKEHLHHGQYLELSPYTRIVFSWNSELVDNTVVEITLAESATGTTLTLNHHGLHNEDHRAAHAHGWDSCLGNLVNLYPMT